MQSEPSQDRDRPADPAAAGHRPPAHPARPRLDSKILAAVGRIAPGTALRSAIDDIIRSRRGRPDRDRRAERARVPVQRRDQARGPVHAAAALRAREDGRRDHRQRRLHEARLRERPADARSDDRVGRDRHAAPHGRARGQADGRARDLDLAAARDGDGLRRPEPATSSSRSPDVLAKTNQALATLETYRAPASSRC